MQKKLIANLYNPHEQTKTELIESFVVRRKTFRKLFREIKRADMKYPEQHFLIEGQRGMGKTTLLLRLSYEIENDEALNSWLIPVVLKEEAYYGFRGLFTLWEIVAISLADRDSVFADLFEQMEKAYDENRDDENNSYYERICFDLLVKALEKQAKKIILFIDNVGEMFKVFNEMESHRLREILMTCAHLRIVGATAATLEASFRYDHAFYEYFKKETLAGLDKPETHHLLLQLAKANQTENAIQNIIDNQPGRVESLRILTGGVIRTVVLLFDIFTDNQNGNAISDLDNILDRVTPLYKHRMDEFVPLQQNLVHAIALNWDAMSTDDIARKIRLKVDKVSEQLGALEKVFIVQRAATDTLTHLYYLSERFFNIWYLMRNAPKGSQNKVIWLVRFLEAWYDKDELVQRAKRQIDALSKGDYYPKGAFVFTEALARTGKLDRGLVSELIKTTKQFLLKKDKSLAQELSKIELELLEKGIEALENNNLNKAFSFFGKITSFLGGTFYTNLALIARDILKNYTQAEKFFLMAVEQEDAEAMNSLGILYKNELKDHTQAEKYYLMAVKKENVHAMYNLGNLYQNELKDYTQAEKYYLMAVDKEYVSAMYNLGFLYDDKLKDYAQAEKYYLMAVEKENVSAMNNLGFLYQNELKDYAQAEKYYLMAVEREHVFAMYNLGNLYQNELKDYAQAKKYFLMAVEKEDVDAMNNLGILYADKLKDYTQAEKYFLMVVEKEDVDAMKNLGFLYADKLKDYAQAEKYYLMAVEKEDVDAMNALAWFYFEHKRRKKGALKYAIQAVEKDKRAFIAHTLACIYLWHNEIEQAIQVAKTFMYAVEAYKKFENDIILFLMLLIAKHQYQHATTYFDAPDLNLKDRFKPLYYALLYFTDDKDYAKRPPEIVEPVNDIIKKIKQMAVDYA